MRALTGSGMSSMSEAWMPFQPAMEEPSNAWPSSNFSLLKYFTGPVACCSLPRVSVKRKSTNFTSLSLTSFNTSSAVIAICRSPERVWFDVGRSATPACSVPKSRLEMPWEMRGSDGDRRILPKPDAQDKGNLAAVARRRCEGLPPYNARTHGRPEEARGGAGPEDGLDLRRRAAAGGGPRPHATRRQAGRRTH